MAERFEREFQIVSAAGTMATVKAELTQNADGTWYAVIKGMGCSRDHGYWYHAVRELMDAHCIKQWF